MIDILKKLEEVLDEQPQEIHISEKKEKNEIFGVLSNALNTKDSLNIEQDLTESLERNEENLLVDGNFDRKVILNQLIKDYRFDKRDEPKEYVYEVVYLINVVLPRVGTILEEKQVLDLNKSQKVNYEIKTSKATIVR